MKRFFNSLAVFLFVVGVLIVPAAHKVALSPEPCAEGCSHAGDDGTRLPAKHDSSRCPVCQLAQLPMVAALPSMLPVPAGDAISRVIHPADAHVSRKDCLLPFSCGPPA